MESGSHGIPRGLKFSMKILLDITSEYGGQATITYKQTGFHANEFFRVLINGVVQAATNANSEGKASADEDGFVSVSTSQMPFGLNSMEISWNAT